MTNQVSGEWVDTGSGGNMGTLWLEAQSHLPNAEGQLAQDNLSPGVCERVLGLWECETTAHAWKLPPVSQKQGLSLMHMYLWTFKEAEIHI